jgi:hypothetical protein
MPHGFPLQHGVKDGDALLPLLLKFSMESLLVRPQEIQEGCKVIETHHFHILSVHCE